MLDITSKSLIKELSVWYKTIIFWGGNNEMDSGISVDLSAVHVTNDFHLY